MKRLMSAVLATALAVGLSGCLDTASLLPNSDSNTENAEQALSPEELELLNQNFPYDIDPEPHYFDREGGPTFEFSDDIPISDMDDEANPFVEVFIDKELTMQIDTTLSFAKKGTFVLQPINATSISVPSVVRKKYGEIEKSLFGFEDWGSVDRIYVLLHRDTQTGKPLERPKLSIHLLNKDNDSYLESPQATMKVNDDGDIDIKWNEVPGAKEYILVKTSVVVGEIPDREIRMKMLARTEKTSWNTNELNEDELEDIKYVLADNVARVEDEQYDPNPNEERLNSKSRENAFIAVMALGDNDKQSGLSNRFPLEALNNKIALRTALHTIDRAMKHSAEHHLIFDNLEDLPDYFPFIMLGGATKFFPLLPKVEETKETAKGLKVKVTSPAADYSQVLTVKSYPKDWKEKLEARYVALKDSKGGVADSPEFSVIVDKNKIINVAVDEAEELKKLKPGETPFGEKIFASNPLSYRISQGLILNHNVIDLSGIPGAEDEHLVYDAFVEATIQTGSNSLIARMEYYPNKKIRVDYRNINRQNRLETAEKSRQKLREVVNELKLGGLSPLEKVRKINRWVIDNTEYNHAALEKEEGSIVIDPDIESAWTIAGTALHNEAVCQGYAKAFVFLAREAGLDAIAVTGNINGSNSDGHMWAAVKIDGEWRYFDPTWNDAPGHEERYFNLKGDEPVITKTHTLDNDYILDSLIGQYK
ncbi:MAG: transglutaminase domain-containing protein [Actinomycetaceae bacterium]|nr:transglutaminase domain-containing protein [Actinomycetaceae bacterium]